MTTTQRALPSAARAGFRAAMFFAAMLLAAAILPGCEYNNPFRSNPSSESSASSRTSDRELNRQPDRRSNPQVISRPPAPPPPRIDSRAAARGPDTKISETASSEARTAALPSAPPSEDNRNARSNSHADLPAGALAYPTGVPATSVLLLQRDLPPEIQVGVPLDYQIVVTNLTGYHLSDVVVCETLPATFKVAHTSPECELAEGEPLVWELDDFAPREERIIHVSGVPHEPGELTSCLSAAYNLMVCQTAQIVQPKLEIELSAPPTILLCDALPIRLLVRNVGTGTARNVNVNWTLPEHLRAVDPQPPIKLDGLPSGESREIILQAKASQTGEYAIQVAATADGDLSASTEPAAIRVTQPRLAVTTAVERDKEFIGRNFRWSVTVKNEGDAPAEDAALEINLPSNAKFASADGGGRPANKHVRWRLGSLEPGAEKSVSLILTALSAGEAAGQAAATSLCAQPVSANLQTTIAGIPALMVEVVNDADPIALGDQIMYVITVTNQGTAAATNLAITCAIPQGQELVSSTGETEGAVETRTIKFKPLASLAPKAAAVWKITSRAVKTGDMRFFVSVTSDQLDTPVEETESTTLYE